MTIKTTHYRTGRSQRCTAAGGDPCVLLGLCGVSALPKNCLSTGSRLSLKQPVKLTGSPMPFQSLRRPLRGFPPSGSPRDQHPESQGAETPRSVKRVKLSSIQVISRKGQLLATVRLTRGPHVTSILLNSARAPTARRETLFPPDKWLSG